METIFADTTRNPRHDSGFMHKNELRIRKSIEGISIGYQKDDPTILCQFPPCKIKKCCQEPEVLALFRPV
jgi:hypothetical protein